MHAYRRDPPHSFSQMQRDTVWCISTVLSRPIKNRGIRLIVTVPYKQYPLILRLHVDILLITVQLHVTITPLTSYCGTMNLLLPSLDTWTNSGTGSHTHMLWGGALQNSRA
jgi:hypothetical protein